MIKQTTHLISVKFGDCDPAGIVWNPNYLKWIDHAAWNFFAECGVKAVTSTPPTFFIPVKQSNLQFLKPATYGDTLTISTVASNWKNSSFVFRHTVMRDTDMILVCDEIRFFANLNSNLLKVVRIPKEIKDLCGVV